ncbi:response regulator [Roseovarius faecimaris]|uniref:Response regulator n=1 Tax=Roseovarius faecimaris TaxID=2494550 RepID=A0A6I6ILA8_9RHOB|nr:response regulator [Roseovarius faecimaris]QGX97679.1 response regulator [Roseovarius faecimaris]
MDDLDPLTPRLSPSAKRPLLGKTVLVVEDSRYASEAMRLMCLRSGARIRRADCLRSARRHLQVYRPSVVIVDLGLPDGSGLDLIDELNRSSPRVGAILGISGEDHMRTRAIAARADGFLAKPVDTVGEFQQVILAALPRDQAVQGPCAINTETVSPDPLAYRDDMSHIAGLLDEPQSGAMLDYVAQFLGSVARLADDRALELAAQELTTARAEGATSQAKLARVAAMVHERMQESLAL